MLYMLKLSGAARHTRLLSLAALEHMVVIIMFYCQPITTPRHTVSFGHRGSAGRRPAPQNFAAQSLHVDQLFSKHLVEIPIYHLSSS